MARIVLMSVGYAILYGILHDMVTAHVCVEYFSVAHPNLLGPLPPGGYALLWGVLATWWVGAGLGCLLACAACLGARPRADTRQVEAGIRRLLLVNGACALLLGLVGAGLAAGHAIWLVPPWTELIPNPVGFFFDAFAHGSSYLMGALLGLRLCWRTWRSRIG